MSILTIGRVGLAGVDLDDPEQLTGASSPAERGIEISGTALGSTLAITKGQRDELIAVANLPEPAVPVTWTGDPTLDGFYRIKNSSFDIRALHDRGFVTFRVSAQYVGAAGEIVFRSKVVGTVLANDHGVTEAESAPFHAPPLGHYAYNPGSTVPSSFTRTGADGAITVYVDVDFAVSPFWSVSPANYYAGAARITVDSTLRAGLTCPNSPDDWQLENGLVRVTPNGSGGRLDVEHHDGTSWETAKTWRIQSGGSDVGEWDAVRILRNTPEECSIRLTRDVSSGGEITLDLSLRRGSRFVVGYLRRHASATLKVVLASAETGQNVTPAGASSAVAVERSSNDGDGNRYVVGSARSFTADLATGGLSKASTTTLDFFIGSEIDGSSAASNDTSEDLALQYLGTLSEREIATPR
jgi:hypothetical protein